MPTKKSGIITSRIFIKKQEETINDKVEKI